MDSLFLKVPEILSHSSTDTKIKELFEIISETEFKNNKSSKQKFKIDNVSNIISTNTKIIKEFEKIIIEFKTFKVYISTIENSINEIEEDINIINSESVHLLEQITTIYNKKLLIDMKQDLLKSFNHHFIIQDDDITLLTSILKPINEKFFEIFFKVKQIYMNCQNLLIMKHKKISIETIEKANVYLDMGFKKLCYVVQQEFKSTQYESYEIKDDIKKAIYILFEKPELFEKCLKTLSEERQNLLLTNFQKALIYENPLISVNPIEIVSRNLLQYTSDMLAWIHQAIANEKGFFETLFKININSESIKIIDKKFLNNYLLEYENINKIIFEIIDNNIFNIFKIFKIKIESIISKIENITTIYKIANLIQFYQFTLEKTLPTNSNLLNILNSTKENIMDIFSQKIEKKIYFIQNSDLSADSQLNAPSFLINAISELKIICESFETTYGFSKSLENHFNPILKVALNPYCNLCYDISNKLDEPYKSIFLINCWKTCEENISHFNFINSKLQKFKDDINNLLKNLELNQLDYFFNSSGLNKVINILEFKEKDNLYESFNAALIQLSKDFDDFLPFAITNALDRIKYLKVSDPATITNKAAELFIKRISDLINIFPQITDNYQMYFHWTSDEIQLLLGL
ncbi:hypothetical protein PCK1_001193 [Pneumocystis canis]|nr:hypothetical protein PCK1_001193 [Pneumocystis canis]